MSPPSSRVRLRVGLLESAAGCQLSAARFQLPARYFVTVNFFASIFAFTLTFSKVISSVGLPSIDR